MEVQMRNGLTGVGPAVRYDAVAGLRDALAPRQFRDDLKALCNDSEILAVTPATEGICALGITRKCEGAWGLMSRKA
jgi:hypothetical protein